MSGEEGEREGGTAFRLLTVVLTVRIFSVHRYFQVRVETAHTYTYSALSLH